jgi:hypothetical protein
MKRNPSWEVKSDSASQEVFRLFRNPNVHYRVHRRLLQDPILSQMNPVHSFPPYFPKIHSNTIFPSRRRSSEPSLPFVLHDQPVSSSPIWSPYYLVKRTSYEAPHYSFLSSLHFGPNISRWHSCVTNLIFRSKTVQVLSSFVFVPYTERWKILFKGPDINRELRWGEPLSSEKRNLWRRLPKVSPELGARVVYEDVSKSFRTESIKKYTRTFGITRCCSLQRVMAAKLTRLIHRIVIQLHLVAERCTICSSFSRRPVRKLLDTPSYVHRGRRSLYCEVNKILWALTPFLLETLRVTLLVKKLPAFTAPGGSLQCSQEPTTRSYPGPIDSSPQLPILISIRFILTLYYVHCFRNI